MERCSRFLFAGTLAVLAVGVAILIFCALPTVYAQEGQPQDPPKEGEPQEPPKEGEPQEPPKEEPEPEDEKPKELTKEDAKAKLDAFKKAYQAAAKDEIARCEAVEALERALHPDIIQMLGQILVGDKSEKVCSAAAEMLGSMQDKRAVTPLDKGLKAHKRKYAIWVYILDALGEIADPTCVPPLTSFLKMNTATFDKNVRDCVLAAIRSLGEVKDKTAIDGLIKCFDLIGVKDSLTEDEQKSIYDSYASEYCNSLSKLTGQNFQTQLEFSKWWQKNAKTFKFPEEEKPE
ncbi:MAG: HEAT repeat domain-containing protein [Planctomycetota bacterium]|nr:HEAT repeat domain-containing protein [Planctomycetota bacterium]